MFWFTFAFSRFPFRRIGSASRLRLVTASLLALNAALSAGPARADCTTDGLDKTCSGNLGIIALTSGDTTEGPQTATLTIDNATNQGVTNTQTNGNAIWTLDITESNYSQASANAVLDIDLDGFQLDSSIGPGVEVTTSGSAGQWHSETKGSGKKEGRDGGVGGAGGVVTATISGLNVNAADEAMVIGSSGGAGGTGAEGYSTGFGNGYGGDGGV
ncbi:unnamed protein product, partial [Ectocarpus sp. 12 AP-2014]